jgi:chromosome segregation ATPase
MTAEAREDDWISLREENADLKAKLRGARSEIAKAKEVQKALEQSGDHGRALGNALRQVDTAKGRLGEELAKNARQARRIKILEGELAAANKRLESQVIPL